MVISFLGPDGSGKSTIIEEIKNNRMFKNYYYFHLKPLISSTQNLKNSVVEDPHQFPVYSKLKSFIKILLFVFQYNFGWFKNIKKINHKDNLIIFDRYYDDLLVDYKRYRYGGSMKIANFFLKFIPRPNIYFVLTAPHEVIFERKKEVEPDELIRQIDSYKKLVEQNKKMFYNINVNRAPNEIAKEINEIIKIHI